MRPTIMGMMGLYSESRIMRCDGDGDIWYFGEGSHWMTNRIRSFFGNIFGLQREGSFILYRERDGTSEQYGNAIETFHGDKSITFNRGFGSQQQITLGSSVLAEPPSNFAHDDFWSLTQQSNTPFREFPPNYVMSACSVLMAFRWINVRHGRGIPGGVLTSAPSPPASFLAEAPPPSFPAATSNASVAFFEETEEDVHEEDANTEGEKV
jgi:hypothetical protein